MRAAAASLTAGLPWKATPSPAASIIGMSLAPSPTASVSSRARPKRSRNAFSVSKLGLAAEHRLGHLPGKLAAGVDQQRIGVLFVEADHRGNL